MRSATESVLDKGVTALTEAEGLHSARVFPRGAVWLLWINGRPIAETNTRAGAYRVLSGILLKASVSVRTREVV